MSGKIIKIGREEREYIDNGIMKIKTIDEKKFMSDFGTEVIDKIVKYMNKPKGAYISKSPALGIKTTNKEEAEWFLSKTGYGHIWHTPRLTMDDLYTWEIVDEAAKSILKGILPQIQSEDILKRAEDVVKTEYFWEGKKYPTFVCGVSIKDIWVEKKEVDIKKPQEKTIYACRNVPAYRDNNYDDITDYCKNPHILKWWNNTHDTLIAQLIEKKQWYWDWDITDKIISITSSKIIESWKEEDPLCKEYAWYNILMYFAKSRAYSLGLVKKIKKPKCKICPLCGEKFLENSLPLPLVELVGGIKRIDFCSPCLSIIYDEGNDNLTRQEVLSYFKELTNILQRVPNYDFGRRKGEFIDFDTKERLDLLKLLKKKPSIGRIKELFGSWFNTLIEAEILEDGVRKTSRGTHCLAKDGHHCLSLGEKTIDDFLYRHNIPHEKEPAYPESNFRADFYINEVFVEYFGLSGNLEYDLKTKKKKQLCHKHGIKLISIYPKDLVSMKKIESKLKELL